MLHRVSRHSHCLTTMKMHSCAVRGDAEDERCVVVSVRAGAGAHQLRRQGRDATRPCAAAAAVEGRGPASHVQHHARSITFTIGVRGV